jgi:hypothetical protein
MNEFDDEEIGINQYSLQTKWTNSSNGRALR